jgi:putative SOS response-associated peptidase YedK
MCGRYTLTATDPAGLRDRFPLGESVAIEPRFNIAPSDHVLAVTTTKEGEPRGELLRWGFVPFWAKDPAIGVRMINARAESLAEKPAFRDALATRRCLIVADGFYEWQAREDRKQPWWITRADHAPFAFAGLWSTWRPKDHPDAEPLRSCTIVTTQASRSLSSLHERMPVLLPPEAEAAWLDHGTAAGALQALLVPAPDATTTAREVGFAVNDTRHDAPDCLDPPPAPDATLF